jgi:hypothetical protein
MTTAVQSMVVCFQTSAPVSRLIISRERPAYDTMMLHESTYVYGLWHDESQDLSQYSVFLR